VSKLLIADLTNEVLRRSVGGAEFRFPVQKQRGKLRFGLRFSEQVGKKHFAIYPTVEEIRVTAGELDKRPEHGDFSLKVGTDSPVVGTNVTADLGYGFTADQLETALNDLSTVSGATVTEDDDSFLIRGITDPITAQGNTLRPITFARVTSYTVDGETEQALRLQRAPLAFADSFDQRVPDPPSVKRLADGGTIGDIEFPEIQQLTIPLDFAGTYRLRTSDNVQKSGLLGVADGPKEVASAINPSDEGLGLASDEDGEFTVTEHPSEPAAIIEFGGSMYGVGQDLLNVEVFSAPDGDYWIELDFDTAATAQALREVDEIRVPLEIFADFENETDIPVYRGEVTIVESVTHDDLGTAQNINYLDPPAAKSYQPVSADSITSGTRFFPFLLGDGSDTGPFSVTHSLDSPRCFVHLRENEADGKELTPGTDFRVNYDDDDHLTITLLGSYASSAPGVDGLSGTVQDLTKTSTWLAHEHPISEVTGLRTELDGIHAEIALLKSLLGSTRRSTLSTDGIAGGGPIWPLPNHFLVYPSRATIQADPGASISTVDFSELDRPRGLLPAVHDASVESLTAALEPASEDFIGRVFKNNWQDFQMISGLGHRFGTLKRGEHVACDGRVWYPVVKYGKHASGVNFTTDYATDANQLEAEGNEIPNGTPVVPRSTGTLPAPLDDSTTYYVVNRTRDTLELSATEGGDPIDLTTDGTGTHTVYVEGDDSFYPRSFEQKLFEISIEEEMLRLGDEFQLQFALEMAVLEANVGAYWTVAVEIGKNIPDDTPGRPGPNRGRDVWRGTPLFEQEVKLSSVSPIHRFGLEIKRSLVDEVDTLAAKALQYAGSDSTVVPPLEPEFLLRGRAIRWDTENSVSDPEGFAVLKGLRFEGPNTAALEGFARII
jgi:hypothetical protein